MKMCQSRWFLRNPAHERRPIRLFCFPYAGGSAAIYREWPQSLGPSIEVLSIELPGHGTRRAELAYSRLAALAPTLLSEMQNTLDRPFAFFGHSMGALLAYEVARRLKREFEIEPLRLFVSGHRAPHLPAGKSGIHAMPDEDFIKELRRLQGTPPEILDSPELMQLLLPSLRADFALCENYVYIADALLSCRICAFGGLNDCDVDQAGLNDWRLHSTGSFSLRMLPGDHFFVHSAAHLFLPVLERELLLGAGMS